MSDPTYHQVGGLIDTDYEGKVRTMVGECSTCGALVSNTSRHSRFHGGTGDLKVGDRVRAIGEIPGWGVYVGDFGELREVDTDDPDLPFLVWFDLRDSSLWVSSTQIERAP